MIWCGHGAGHRVYPYLLRGLPIERPDQVWGVDIIPLKPHRHPPARRLPVPGGVPRLVLAPGRGVGVIRDAGNGVRAVQRRGRARMGGARDHQQRLGQPLHQ